MFLAAEATRQTWLRSHYDQSLLGLEHPFVVVLCPFVSNIEAISQAYCKNFYPSVETCFFGSQSSLAGTGNYWIMLMSFEQFEHSSFLSILHDNKSRISYLFIDESQALIAHNSFRPKLYQVVRYLNDLSNQYTFMPVRLLSGTASRASVKCLSRSSECGFESCSLHGFEIPQFDSRGALSLSEYKSTEEALDALESCVRNFFHGGHNIQVCVCVCVCVCVLNLCMCVCFQL